MSKSATTSLSPSFYQPRTELDDIPQDLPMLSADQDDIQMSNENADIQMPPAPPS